MKHIRPWQFWEMYDGAGKTVSIPLPHRRGLGGLMLLETMVLLVAAKIVNAKRIFEIGTFLGGTSYVLAKNTDAEIFTLDLAPEDAKALEQNSSEAEITSVHLANKMDFDGTPEADRIHTLFGNSTTFEYAPYVGLFDMVFIDGGHELPTLQSDTENAFRLLGAKGCVIWHDYGNPDYPELRTYLDSLPLEIFHIEDTWLCFHLR